MVDKASKSGLAATSVSVKSHKKRKAETTAAKIYEEEFGEKKKHKKSKKDGKRKA